MKMTYSEIQAMVHETGFSCAYDHFSPEDAVDPPFVVWLFPDMRPYAADDSVWLKRQRLNIELYTDVKDPAREQAVESVLDAHGFVYEKTEQWISTEKMYEVLYQMEVVYAN